MVCIDFMSALGILGMGEAETRVAINIAGYRASNLCEVRETDEKGMMRARRLPLTFNFVPSSATSSPFLFRQALERENDSMFVSRASDAGGCLRMLAAASAATTGGVDVVLVGVAVPAAFRFFGFVAVEVAPGTGSLATWLFALEWAPFVVTVCADSFERFASVVLCALAAADAPFL